MFFETYKKLCEEHNEKPYSLPIKLGAKSNSIVAQWKSGSLPRPEMLQSIADYFGVSVGYLIDGEGKKEKPASVSEDGLSPVKQEAWKLIQSLDDEALKKFVETMKLFSELK